jgi:polyribonucleotide nucleotidyltransferase
MVFKENDLCFTTISLLFQVGETGRIGTGRREIGHGKLAWRAINSSLAFKRSVSIHF